MIVMHIQHLLANLWDGKISVYHYCFRNYLIESPILIYDGDCGESLTIYDSDHTFSRPGERVDFMSTSSSLYMEFDSKTGSYSGSLLYCLALYDFFNDTRFSDPMQNTLCIESMYAWKHPGGKIHSLWNSLNFKRKLPRKVRD